jgi:hypothetical protein
MNDEFIKFIIHHLSFIIMHSFLSRMNHSVTVVAKRREGDKNGNKSEYISKTIDFQYFREKKSLDFGLWISDCGMWNIRFQNAFYSET